MKVNSLNTAELSLWADVDAIYEDSFNEWYNRENMKERAVVIFNGLEASDLPLLL